MVINYLLQPPLFNVNRPSHSATYGYFKIWPWKSMVNAMCVVKGLGHIWPWKLKYQGHRQGQSWWSHLRPKVQSIGLLFVSWQSHHFGLRYSTLHIWPWKSRSWPWPRSNPIVTFEAQCSIDMFTFMFRLLQFILLYVLNSPTSIGKVSLPLK